MAKDENRPYDLHPEDDDPGPALPEEKPRRSGRPPDTCPNCGATMVGSNALVCIRCGFDLKTLKVLGTEEGVVQEPEEDEQRERPETVSPPGGGGEWLPIAVGGGSVLVLIVGYLAGAAGLFPAGAVEEGETAIRFAARFTELGRFAVLAIILIGCGMLALLGLALLWNASMGDARLALLRVAAIVLAMRLAAFVSFGRRSVEWTVEMILQAAILLGLSMLLLRLKPRDALLYALLVLLSLGGVWAIGHLATWVLA